MIDPITGLETDPTTQAADTAEPGDTADPTLDPKKELARWRQRVSRARKLREDWEKKYNVEECEKFYLGEQWVGLKPGEKVINHFLATVRVTLPNLLYDQPKFLTRAKPGVGSPVSSDQIKAAEGVLNSIGEQDDNLRTASRLGLLQNFWRIGVIKVVYDPYLEQNPRAGEPIYQQDTGHNTMYDPQSGEPMPEMDPATGQPLTEPPEIVCDDTYRFEWVDARLMLLPDDGPDQKKWPWVGEEVEVELADAKKDQRFAQTLRDEFKASGKKDDDPDRSSYRDETEDHDPCFKYIEVHDIKNRRHLIFTEDQKIDEFLLDEPTQDGIEDHPYAILPGWFPIVGPKPSPWPLPYTSPWTELQTEYNISREQQISGGKRSARKVFFEKGTFEDPEEAVKALQSSKDMEGVCLMDVNRPPKMMEDSDLNQAIYKSSASIMMDWRLVTGQTGAKVGLPDADTATEATFVSQASNLRDADLQKEVTNWLKVAGKKMLQLVKQTLTLRLWVNMRGMDDKAIGLYLQSTYGVAPEQMMAFPALKNAIVQRFGENRIQGVTREDLQGEYDIDVVPGSTRPRNLSTERSQLLEFAALIAQNPTLALVRPLLEAISKTFEQIDDTVVEALHAGAMMMIQAQQANAGRQQGGVAGQPENQQGSEMAQANGNLSQVSQGTELM